MEDATKEKNRKIHLDFLRVIAMMSVVMIHVFSTARTDFPNHNQQEKIITNIITGMLHYAVPIFFMITGTLFLNPNKKITISMLYKKYLKRYLLVILFFGFGFAFIEQILNNGINASAIIDGFVNTITGNTWAHMWYLYTLVGVMMILPIIKLIVDSNDGCKMLKYMLILLIIFSSILPIIKDLFGFEIGIKIPIDSIYVAYMIIGYLLDSVIKKEIKAKCSLLIILISLLIIVVSNIVSIIKGVESLKLVSSYYSPVIMLLSVGIFLFFKGICEKQNQSNKKIINYLSEVSFGVYIVHMFFINVIYKFLKINIYGEWMVSKCIAIYLIVLALSIITVRIVKKMPVLKKLI